MCMLMLVYAGKNGDYSSSTKESKNVVYRKKKLP